MTSPSERLGPALATGIWIVGLIGLIFGPSILGVLAISGNVFNLDGESPSSTEQAVSGTLLVIAGIAQIVSACVIWVSTVVLTRFDLSGRTSGIVWSVIAVLVLLLSTCLVILFGSPFSV